MAGRIIYLEVDDEITSAATRIRTAEASRLAVVLPYGSRVATSRINFRLLSRDALTHEKRLSIVSGDPATRALAASAGLPVFASVAEYEASVAGLEDEPREGRRPRPWPGQEPPPGRLPRPMPRPGGRRPRRRFRADASRQRARAWRTGGRGDAAAAVETAGTPIEAAHSDGTLGLVIPAAAVGAAAASPSVVGETVRSPVSRAGPSPTAIPAGPAARHAAPPAAGVGRRRSVAAGSGRPGSSAARSSGWRCSIGGVGVYLLLPSATIVVTPRPSRSDRSRSRSSPTPTRPRPTRPPASCRPRSSASRSRSTTRSRRPASGSS